MRTMRTWALVTLMVLAFASFTPAANNSEQVVFSGAGSSTAGPFGFWIWCEGESSNPYNGVCSGAMYFYALGLTRHVDGSVTEIGSDLYRMIVTSRDGTISCTLENTTLNRGPHNTVNATCTVSTSGVTGSVTNAVVNVTGP